MSIPGRRVNDNVYEFEDRSKYIPEKLSCWKTIRFGIYDPSTGKFLGRTRSSWGVVSLFYLVFFTSLAIFCAICYEGLMATIDENKPTYILEESLIGTSPGLGYRPYSEETGSLIWYNATNETDVAIWTEKLDTFLSVYVNRTLLPTKGRNQQICSKTQPLLPGKVCAFDLTDWGECSPGSSYGFNNSAPCIFIKLNKIYGWKPSYYNADEPLPEDMPENISDYIKSSNNSALEVVWVSCHGHDPLDTETIGDLEYYPKIHGFPEYYYPYENTPGYLAPLVAVRFLRPKRNVIINVECRAWAKNIRYSKIRDETSSVSFSLMID